MCAEVVKLVDTRHLKCRELLKALVGSIPTLGTRVVNY